MMKELNQYILVDLTDYLFFSNGLISMLRKLFLVVLRLNNKKQKSQTTQMCECLTRKQGYWAKVNNR